MSRSATLSERFRLPAPGFLLCLFLPVGVILGGIALLRLVFGIPTAELTRDPAQIAGFSPFLGLLSQLGALLWSGTTAVCLFSGVLAGGRDTEPGRFLLAGAAVTAVLTLDDFFLLHDVVFPVYLGIGGSVAYAAYALLILGFLARFRQHLLERTELPLLALALGLFGLSLAVDVVIDTLGLHLGGSFLVEDGFKFAGIAAWGAFFARTAARALRRAAAGAGR